jgi:hypothetical protein
MIGGQIFGISQREGVIYKKYQPDFAGIPTTTPKFERSVVL